MGEIADAIIEGILSEDGEYVGAGARVSHRRRRSLQAPPPKPERRPVTERPTSPINVAARILAGMPVTDSEMRILAHFALGCASAKTRADLAAAFPPIPTPTQEG